MACGLNLGPSPPEEVKWFSSPCLFPPPGTGGGQEGGFAESAGPLLVWGGPPPDLPLKGEEKSRFLATICSPAELPKLKEKGDDSGPGCP